MIGQFSVISTILGLVVFIFLAYGLKKLAFYLRYQQVKKQIGKCYKLYDYPFSLGLAGYVKQWRYHFVKYGDSFYSRKHFYPHYDVSISTQLDVFRIGLINVDLIKQYIDKSHQGYYQKSKTGSINTIGLYQFVGDGLLMTEGDQWKSKRKIMSGLFNHEFIKTKINTIIEITQQVLNQVKSQAKNNIVQFKTINTFENIFGNVVIKCFFGNIKIKNINGKSPFNFLSEINLKILSRNFLISTYIIGPKLMLKKFRKIDTQIIEMIDTLKNFVKQMISQIMEEVKAAKNNQCDGLIATLIKEKRLVESCSREEKIQKGLYTYKDLVDELCTFFFAGADTTSSVAASIIHVLINNKQIEKKVREEITLVLDDNPNNLNYESIKKLTYLGYVQSQALRMMSSVPFIMTRTALKDHKLKQLFIPKGMNVTVEIMANSYKEEYYDKPHQFKPQRWEKIPNPPTNPYSFFPFSIGQRSCIGQQLSLIESKMAIAIFLMNFKNGRQERQPRYEMRVIYALQNLPTIFELK